MKKFRPAMLVVAWGCAVLAVCAFTMPWVHLDVHEPTMLKQVRQAVPLQGTLKGLTHGLSRIAVKIKRGAETVTGDINLGSLQNLPREITGAQIPQLANSSQAQLALVVMQMMTGTASDIGRQSYAVYLLPGLAVLAALLLTMLGRWRIAALSVAIVCALIAAVGFWNTLTAHTTTAFVTMRIGQGVWLSLWAYVGVALAAAGLAIML